MEKLILKIEGMSCASCAMNVEKALKKVKGVENAVVNLASEKALITFNPKDFSEKDAFEAVEKAGYKALYEKSSKKDDSDEFLEKVKKAKQKMIYAWAITIPLSFIMFVHMFFNIEFKYHTLINLILSFPVIFIIGIDPIKSAIKALIHKNTNMDVLIFFGVTSSYLTGILNLFGQKIADYSGVGAMITGFYLIGQYLESKAKGRASEEIKKLLNLSPKKANLVKEDGSIEIIDIDFVKVSDILLVKPSEQIPTDSVIIEGTTSVDESMITGESLPVPKSINDTVIGGTINQLGTIKIKVTQIGENTVLSKISKLVEDAQSTKVPVQAFADRVISIFVPSIIIIAILTFIVWFLFPSDLHKLNFWAKDFLPWINPNLNTISAAIYASVATLVIACPCALGLATPTALMVGLGLGASKGILIRSGEALERAKDIDVVVFDKTGTITDKELYVTDIVSNIDKEEFIKIVASLESYSEHPIGIAINKFAKDNNISKIDFQSVKVIPGLGVEGYLDNKKIIVGSPKFIEDATGIKDIEKSKFKGKTLAIAYEEERGLLGIIALSFKIKPNAKEAIDQIKKMGIKTIMLTGDNEETARYVASQVEIDEYFANLLPQDKIMHIKRLQEMGYVVAMVGDGINDAPSLKQSDVGISIGTGTDIAKEASNITLMTDDLTNVAKSIKLSIATFKKIKQNLFWAFFYNIIAIPFAALGMLHPVIAEAAMATSSVFVVTNSIRLRNFKI
ncbi:heavy metal translocating P-type ATPase [Thermodesulfobium narugense DSM 14796]|uniref:P-type Cu(2+) transporter n=1 Tax=Thermodesulfobium narugense DSM 14796 TaxID=747365 RepID=M1E6B3_9BACT|nr:cation-translocating P-type ATPase [Thermodesulfobium narugense]AEE14078.1 heavy metal translocating P-type ATPase [Thermodesulfobium narugense DSM 14796]